VHRDFLITLYVCRKQPSLLTLPWLDDAMQAMRSSRWNDAASIDWSSICVYPRSHALTLALRRRALNRSLAPSTPNCGLFVQHSLCNVLHNFWVSLTTYHYSGVELWPWLYSLLSLISSRSLQKKHVDHFKNVTSHFPLVAISEACILETSLKSSLWTSLST
jgi:hypothetical protein